MLKSDPFERDNVSSNTDLKVTHPSLQLIGTSISFSAQTTSILARICTELKNKEAVLKLVSEYFDGFTAIEATGMWKGVVEASLIIEIVCLDDITVNKKSEYSFHSKLVNLARDIRELNGQECVMIQLLHMTYQLIEKE